MFCNISLFIQTSDTSLTGLTAQSATGAAAGWGSSPGPWLLQLTAFLCLPLTHTHIHIIHSDSHTKGSRNEPRTLLPWHHQKL